jgi:GTPase-activating protein SST2
MAVSNPSHPNHRPSPGSSSASNLSSLDSCVEGGSLGVPRLSISGSSAPTSSSGDSTGRPAVSYKHRQATQSTSSSKPNRTGLFNLAAFARDKTSSAIASLSDQPLRTRISSGSLSRQSIISSTGGTSQPLNNGEKSRREEERRLLERAEVLWGSSSGNSSQPSTHRSNPSEPSSSRHRRKSLLDASPPSQPYEITDSSAPSPIAVVPQTNYNKMHQTSSRLLRMTDDDRPFTRVSIHNWSEFCKPLHSPTRFFSSLFLLSIGRRISRTSFQPSSSACHLSCTE